jgi:hypothetical protein
VAKNNTRPFRALRGMTRTLGHWWCGVHGHEAVLVITRERLAVRCGACGYESPGWTFSALSRPEITAPQTSEPSTPRFAAELIRRGGLSHRVMDQYTE